MWDTAWLLKVVVARQDQNVSKHRCPTRDFGGGTYFLARNASNSQVLELLRQRKLVIGAAPQSP